MTTSTNLLILPVISAFRCHLVLLLLTNINRNLFKKFTDDLRVV